MTDDGRLDALRREIGSHLRSWAGRAPRTPSCLSDDVVAQLAEGSAAADVRAAAVAHLAVCGRCRADLAEVVRAIRDPRVAASVPGHASARRWLLRAAGPLAAAALLLLVLRPTVRDGVRRPHRERGVLAGPAPVARAPIGMVAKPRALTWSAVPGADRYRVTLFDGDSVVYEAELRDTLAALPNSVLIRSGRTYLWKVEARTGFDRWVSSDLVRFSLPPEPGR